MAEAGTNPVEQIRGFDDPDAYKEDWYDSLIFKRAMKAEAIKRGVRYDSDFSIDDADEHIEMTTVNQTETITNGAGTDSRGDVGRLDGDMSPSIDRKTEEE